VDEIKATLVANQQQANLKFQCARGDKTFTDQHGEVLASLLHRWCAVGRDEDLPPVHALLLKSPKSHSYSILNAMLKECTRVADASGTGRKLRASGHHWVNQ
jgi:hypothetical protein